jgi:hypothetical protein
MNMFDWPALVLVQNRGSRDVAIDFVYCNLMISKSCELAWSSDIYKYQIL